MSEGTGDQTEVAQVDGSPIGSEHNMGLASEPDNSVSAVDEQTQTQKGWWITVRRYLTPLTIAVGSRLGLFAVVYLSLVFIPMRVGDGLWRDFKHNLFIDGWTRFDAGWYASIAEKGYTNIAINAAEQHDTAFFPFYPLVMRIANILVGDIMISGIIVSNLCFVIALLLLYKLVSDHYDGESTAWRTILFIALGPFSLFFSAAYTESIFLLAVVGAFVFAEKRRWVWAGLFAAAAGATRVAGVTVIVGLLLLYLQQVDFNWRRIRPNILWLGLGMTGILAHMTYLGIRFGNPLQFVESQNVPGWGANFEPVNAIRILSAVVSVYGATTGDAINMDVIHLLIMIAVVALLLLSLRRLPIGYGIWGLLMVAVSFSAYRGMGRYTIVIFPIYIVLALYTSERTATYLAVLSTFLLTLFAIMFSHWFWVA
jgi:hypothetical protein